MSTSDSRDVDKDKNPKDKDTKPPKNPKDPPKPKDSEEATIGIVGYGLNLFDADPWNSPFKDKRILTAPIQTARREVRVTKYEDTYQDNFLDMTHTLAVESGLKGSYGDFIGSVTSKYTSTDRKIEKRHLQRISHSTHLYDLSLASSPSELKGKLEPKFKSDLETMPTGELFALYGSHLVHKIRMGGRAEYFCQTADLTSMTEREFKATAQAKYKSLGGKVQSDTSYGTVDKKKERLVTGSTTINAIGGSSAGIKDPDSWDDWAKTVPANPGFLGFDKDAGLVPIWQLTDNAARSKEIHEAYKRKAARALRTEIFTATSSAAASWPEARVTVPAGYKLLSGGARNNWKDRAVSSSPRTLKLIPQSLRADRGSPKERTILARSTTSKTGGHTGILCFRTKRP
jgi:MAC/Perforin domain